jgi:alanyl-tRNA synthetase
VSLVAVVGSSGDIDAPALIGPAARIVGGGGGGKKRELAQAGGRDVTRLDDALNQVRATLGLPPS